MHKYKGAIVAHIGPMFGGKTSGLLADVRKMTIAKYNVALFKPKKDDRYAENKVVNHDGESINAINIVTFQDIIDYVESNPKVNVMTVQTAGYDNVVIPENIYRGLVTAGWTGKETTLLYETTKIWDEAEKNANS